jgi:hypothetical protein
VLKTGANGINGLNVLRFSNSGGNNLACYLEGSFNPAGDPGMTVFYVARTVGSGTIPLYSTVLGWHGASLWWSFNLGSDSGSGVGWAGTTGAVGLGTVSSVATNQVRYASYRTDKADWTIAGVRTATVADSSFPIGSLPYLVGSNDYPNSQSNGDIGEILVYNRPLSDAEIETVNHYLQQKWGMEAVNRVVQISEEGIGAPFVVRYVHPNGSDDNDGTSWAHAKETVLAAYDSLPAGNTTGMIYIHDGSYIGGEVPSQGIWIYTLYGSTPPAGWRPHRLCVFQGVGGPMAQFTPGAAVIKRGRPGDSQTWDLDKPHIWISGCQQYLEFRNLTVEYGFTRLGVDWTGARDALVSSQKFHGCTMAALPDTAVGTTGPAWDIGYANMCWFEWCSAYGSTTAETPDNDLDDDDHAGWLIKPTIDGGAVGSTGMLYFSHTHPVACGIKYYLGYQGSFGLVVEDLLSEGRSPHLIWLGFMPGSTARAINPQCLLVAKRIQGADRQTDWTLIWIDPEMWTELRTGMIVAEEISGVISGPATITATNSIYNVDQQTTQWRQKQTGILFDGKISGQIDAGRRLGAPGAAIKANLASDYPSGWTTFYATLTPGTTDVFGGSSAFDLTGSQPEGYALVTTADEMAGDPPAPVPMADGDMVVAGVWVRGPAGGEYGGLDGQAGLIETRVVGGGKFVDYNVRDFKPPGRGNGEWNWLSFVGVYKTPAGSPYVEDLRFLLRAKVDRWVRYCFPMMIILHAADGWSETEAWELMAHAATWNPALPQGAVGTLREQAFGLGGHLLSLGGEPAVAAGAGAGTGATVEISGTDTSGTIVVTTGTSPAAGILATVTFAVPFASAPRVRFQAANAAAAAVSAYPTESTTTFTISATAGAAASIEHKWHFFTVG